MHTEQTDPVLELGCEIGSFVQTHKLLQILSMFHGAWETGPLLVMNTRKCHRLRGLVSHSYHVPLIGQEQGI